MINTSFVRRQLRIVIQLYKGEFEDGGNTKTIEDLAMTCSIQKLAYPECGKASVEIAGMRLPDMEQLSTLAFDPLYVKNNQLTIYAETSTMSSRRCSAAQLRKPERISTPLLM